MLEGIACDIEAQIAARKMTRQGSPGEGVAGVGRGGRQPRICDTYLFSDAAETFILAEDMKEFSTIGSGSLLRSEESVCWKFSGHLPASRWNDTENTAKSTCRTINTLLSHSAKFTACGYTGNEVELIRSLCTCDELKPVDQVRDGSFASLAMPFIEKFP